MPGNAPEMRIPLVVALSCALLGLCAPAADASPNVRFGIQDDAWLTHGSGTLDDRLDRLERLGVDVVRFNLHWDRIEPSRGEYDWEDSDAVLNGLRESRDPGRRRHRRLAHVGERRQGAELRPRRVVVRRLRPRGRLPLPLGEAVADVERAEPGSLAASDLAERLRPPDPQSRLRGGPRSDPARQGRRRRHCAPRFERRRLARQMDPRDAQRARPPRRVRAPSLPVEHP